MFKNQYVEESPISKFIFGNTSMAWLWIFARVYVGWQWFSAGWGKLHDAAWVGSDAGSAIAGFVNGAISKAAGAHPAVQGWYASFLERVILPHTSFWSHAVTYGELLVGVALIIGAFTGIAAFFGLFMNLNYLLAGTVSINPVLFTISIFLILAWRVAGYIGLDYYLLPLLGTPWKSGKVFNKEPKVTS